MRDPARVLEGLSLPERTSMRIVPPFVAFTRARGPDPASRLEEGVADPEPGSGDGAESIGDANVLAMAVGM